MELPIIEVYRRVLEEPSEENRAVLVESFLRDPKRAIETLSRFLGGEHTPDTVVARTAAENVIAAVVLNRISGNRAVKVVAPREPIRGWAPLNTLLDELAQLGYIHVYRTSFSPNSRVHAKKIVHNVAKIARGLSAKIADVSDTPPPVLAGLYAGGVRRFLVLVYLGHVAVYQQFSFTA